MPPAHRFFCARHVVAGRQTASLISSLPCHLPVSVKTKLLRYNPRTATNVSSRSTSCVMCIGVWSALPTCGFAFTLMRSYPYLCCSRCMQRQPVLVAAPPPAALFAVGALINLPAPSCPPPYHSAAMNMQHRPQRRQWGASYLFATAALLGTVQAFLLPFNTPAQPPPSLAKDSGLWWQQQRQQGRVRRQRRKRTKEADEEGKAVSLPHLSVKYLVCVSSPPAVFRRVWPTKPCVYP